MTLLLNIFLFSQLFLKLINIWNNVSTSKSNESKQYVLTENEKKNKNNKN